MSRRSNPQIPFFHFAILLFTLLLIAYMVFLFSLSTLSPRTSHSPTPSPALTNNTLTLSPNNP